jgi:hypothetical protein
MTTLRLPKRTDKVRGAFHAVRGRAQARAQARVGNLTSDPATRLKSNGKPKGRRFGQLNQDMKDDRSIRRGTNLNAVLTGSVIGTAAGSPAYLGTTRRDRKIAENKEKLEKRFIPRGESVHLITDVGTKAAEKAHHPGRWGMAGIAGGAGLTATAGLATRKEQKKTLAVQQTKLRARKPVSKARSMSDTELRHRQKIQGKIARTTSTLGLSGLGITGVAAVAARKGRVGTGTLKAIRKVPKLGNATPEGMKNAAINTGIVSGGIGGVGGFNQASIYSAESRRRKQAVPVKKSEGASDLGMEMGYFGEEGHAITHEQIEEEIAKAWEPVARNYDPEAKRHARAKKYEVGGASVAAGTGTGAVAAGVHALKNESKNRTAGQIQARHLPNVKAAQAVRHAKATRSGKLAAGLGGVAAVTGAGAALAHHGRRNSWQSYEKRDTTSAFGVDHSDNPNGQHRETEN